jgi:xanthine dehydrogenase accessory factor
MEELILKKILENIEEHKKVALVTLTDVGGSTPRDTGSLMLVWENGETYGSIGGGKVEYFVTGEAVEALKEGVDRSFEHSLTPDGDLKMQCGGTVKGFIKIFKPSEKIIIAGGGHVGEKVLELAKFLGFNCEVIDDREDYINKPSLQKADKITVGYYKDIVKDAGIDESTYVVITTKSHITDLEFVKEVLKTKARYIGVIGSQKKQIFVRETLLKEGFSEEDIKRIYGPVGINISNQMPEEIAVSILAEILVIKNNGTLEHRKLEDSVIESILKKHSK